MASVTLLRQSLRIRNACSEADCVMFICSSPISWPPGLGKCGLVVEEVYYFNGKCRLGLVAELTLKIFNLKCYPKWK